MFKIKKDFLIILNPIFLSLGDEGDACQSKNFERSDHTIFYDPIRTLASQIRRSGGIYGGEPQAAI